jgi:tetratricopeptide (TPR) repeat protein
MPLSKDEIWLAILEERVTGEVAGAMFDNLAVDVPGAESLVGQIGRMAARMEFVEAARALAAENGPNQKLVLSLLTAGAGIEEASSRFENLVSDALSGREKDRTVQLLRWKGHLFALFDPQIAINAYARLLGLAPNDPEANEKLATYHRDRADLARSERYFRALLDIPDVSVITRISALTDLAAIAETGGRSAEADEFRARARAEMRRYPEMVRRQRSAEIERLGRLVAEAGELGDNAALERWGTKLLTLENEAGLTEAAANTMFILAETAANLGHLDTAAERFDRAAQAFDRLSDDESLRDMLWFHGLMEAERGEFETAEKLLERSLSIDKKLGDEASAASTIFLLAEIAQKRGKHGRAERRFKKALRKFMEMEDHGMAGAVCKSLADLARERGSASEQRDWVERAIGHLEKAGDRDSLAAALSVIGAIDLALDDCASAEHHYRLASEIYQEQYDHESNARALSAIGDLAYRRGDLDAARDAWGKALTRYQNVDMWNTEQAARLRRLLDETRFG